MGLKIGKLKYDITTMVGTDDDVMSPIVLIDGDLDLINYDDITSISSWVKYYDSLCTDRLQLRLRIIEILNTQTWSGISDEERDIVIKYYLKETSKSDSVANEEKVIFLMGKGFSFGEVQGLLIKSYSIYHLMEIESCYSRANSAKLFEVIAKYLTLVDAADLINITHKLFDLYKTQGIRGVNDGSVGAGLFDFLESTVDTMYETSGLQQQGYVLNTGDYTTFISELMDVLKYGNY